MSRSKQAIYACVALCFWMVMTQMTVAGLILMALFLVGLRIEPRFELDDKKLTSVMDGCVILLFMTLILVWNLTERRREVFLITMSWLPIIASPMFLFLYYSKPFKFDPKCLVFLLRYLVKANSKNYAIDSTKAVWALMVVCFLSSSVGFYAQLYYPLIALIVFVVLLVEDTRKEKLTKRMLVLGFTLCLGYGFHTLYFNAGQYFRRQSVQFLLNFTNQQEPPRRQWTEIGEHSQIQLSSEVVMRVKTEASGLTYFKGAHFDEFMGETHWFNTMEFEEVELEENDSIHVQSVEAEDQTGELWYQGQGEAWIPLAKTTSKVQIPNIPKIEMWNGQVIRVPPPFGWLHVKWQGHSSLSRKDAFDPEGDLYLTLPEDDTETWKNLVKQNKWDELDNLEQIKHVLLRHFRTFTYSLDAMSLPKGESPIFYFLETTKKGHCEHFATAATLILRTLGYRARYCTGYVVREYSDFQKTWLVRGRDAHAWVEVWNGQHWERFEPTPPSPMSGTNTSWSRPIKDRWDWLMFQIDKLRFQGHVDRLRDVAPWGIGLVMLYLMARMFKIVGFKRKKKEVELSSYKFEVAITGCEILEETMAKNGLPREKGETWENWILRLEQNNSEGIDLLKEIKSDHLKMVYTDEPISDTQRSLMKEKCLNYLEKTISK